ncbi:DUF2644 domain-containing protein [Oligella urethralis]|uniref:DUF2644 domain-containing protein n=1 Tax=Oligella urethralis TaxID=90245 RepID=UPI0028891B69|nr:DUF2644 domain-containing protein [Oligella urethralis]
MTNRLNELVTNHDGRLSTTTSIQFFGAALMAMVLIYSVWMDRSYVAELFGIFALFCGGGAATKGAVTVMRRKVDER